MNTYKTILNSFGETIVVRTDENGGVTYIPTEPANSDYQAYLASLQAPQANSTES